MAIAEVLPGEDEAHEGFDLDALRVGDVAAFEALVRRLTPRLLAVARRIVDDARAEDVVQEAWLVVHDRIGGFEGRSRLETWITRIVVNGAISESRRYGRNSADGGPGEDPAATWFDERGSWRDGHGGFGEAPDDLLEAETLRDCLRAGVDRLPPRQRRVLVLRQFEQWPLEDVCNELGIGASNGRVLLHRGRMKLMEIVDRYRRTGRC
jgi:RNA polymerase sigma-70 factor (ECF subfamily)